MTNPTEAAIRERAQESHAYALMVLGDMFNALHLQAAELERVTAALEASACNCQWINEERAYYCNRCKGLAGAARAAQEGDV
jgi:UDP-2,3-diacylglucosamine pyrophosphatase LpxH